MPHDLFKYWIQHSFATNSKWIRKNCIHFLLNTDDQTILYSVTTCIWKHRYLVKNNIPLYISFQNLSLKCFCLAYILHLVSQRDTYQSMLGGKVVHFISLRYWYPQQMVSYCCSCDFPIPQFKPMRLTLGERLFYLLWVDTVLGT